MLPATLIQILSFSKFLSFPMFGMPPPPSTVITVYVTDVYAHSSPPPSKKSDRKTVRQPHR